MADQTWKPRYLIAHESGNAPGAWRPSPARLPYHVLVNPDGTSIYRYGRENPFAAPAEHAHRLNPQSIGVAYNGPVGATPTTEAQARLRYYYDLANRQFPGIATMGHGEAFAQRGQIPRASRDGRSLREGQWYRQFGAPMAAGAPQMHTLGYDPATQAPQRQTTEYRPERDGTHTQLMQPAGASAPPAQPAGMAGGDPPSMASRSLVAYAGMQQPARQALPDLTPTPEAMGFAGGGVDQPQASYALGGPTRSSAPPPAPAGAAGGFGGDADAQPGGFYGGLPMSSARGAAAAAGREQAYAGAQRGGALAPPSMPMPIDHTYSPEARRWNEMGFTPAPGFVDQPTKQKMGLGALRGLF